MTLIFRQKSYGLETTRLTLWVRKCTAALRNARKEDVFFALVLTVIAINSTLSSIKAPLNYDEGYILQIPVNISKGLGYRSMGADMGDIGKPRSN